MKKTFAWFEGHDVAFSFHDYKKQGVDEKVLAKAIKEHGWETVINKRGTTWRQLSETQKSQMDDKSAMVVALENPSIIKRPLIASGDVIIIGFDVDAFARLA